MCLKNKIAYENGDMDTDTGMIEGRTIWGQASRLQYKAKT